MHVWLLVAFLAVGGSSLAQAVETAFPQDSHQTARKIDGSSHNSHQAFYPAHHYSSSKEANTYVTKKDDVHQMKNSNTGANIPNYPSTIHKADTSYSNEADSNSYGMPANVKYVKKSSLITRNGPQRVIYKKKKNSNMFGIVFKHLFEIIQEVLSIMTKMEPSNASNRIDSDGANENSKFDSWPLIKVVFSKYISLLRETELLGDVREIIPIDDLENVLENGDPSSLLQVIMKSFTPSFFSYIFQTIKELFTPVARIGQDMKYPELREYVPSKVDLMYPFRFITGRALKLIGRYFSGRELQTYWEQFSSYSPFAARSLEYIMPLEEEMGDDQPGNSLFTQDSPLDRVQEERSFLARAMTDPYVLLAGIGTTALASVIAFRWNSASGPSNNRVKRTLVDDNNSSPLDNMSHEDVFKIVSAAMRQNVDTIDEGETKYKLLKKTFKPKSHSSLRFEKKSHAKTS